MKKLINKRNQELKYKLIPEPEYEIKGNSFINPNDKIFHEPIKKKTTFT